MTQKMAELLAHWRAQSWSNPRVTWRDGWLENGFCPECRRCCGPQKGDPPYPMPLLDRQCGPKAEEHLYLLNATTAVLDERGCKALGPHGCTLVRDDRPPTCGLFPLVVLEGALWLYILCPAALFLPLQTWYALGHDAGDWVREALTREEIARISLSFPADALLERFIPLYTSVETK